MRRMANLFRKDVLLGIKDVFIILEVGFAVAVVLILLFIIPEDIESEATVFIYDETGLVETFVQAYAGEFADQVGEFYVDSREAIIDGMTENRSALGLILSTGPGGHGPGGHGPGGADTAALQIELLHQPYTPPALIDYVETDLKDMFAVFASLGAAQEGVTIPGPIAADLSAVDVDGGGPVGYPPEILERVRVTGLEEGVRDSIPFNRRLMPIVILMMVGILGLFSMVSLLGQERADQTLRAYKVTPSSLWQFVTSKHLMVLATSVLTFSILYIPMFGLSGYLPALLITALTVVFGSGLGALLGTFNDDPMGSIGWVLVIVIVLGLPAVSLLAPTFSPGLLRIIPSYHTLFGLDAAMFDHNGAQVIRESAAALAGFALVFYLLSGGVFVARSRREA